MNFIKVRGVKVLKPFKIEAIVLFPFVLFASSEPDEKIDNHERIHLDQIKRDGVLMFYSRYLLEYYRSRRRGLSHDLAYRAISYEKEAYQHQKDILYRVADRK
ncbi:MAG: hypothetical protein H0V66_02575 [Bdellovibrionales bacterium]|nr:hypothetical protein [Bdellovibrionales bacterium]